MSVGTVLIVEDFAVIRLDAVAVFESLGFEVLDTDMAEEALFLLQERPDVRLIFTDIRLGGAMDGVTLAILVRERRPDIEIILTSGEIGDVPGFPFVPKPWLKRDILKALAAAGIAHRGDGRAVA